MDFETCFQIVVKAEGGYNCNPKDNGGATKFGISQKSYPHLNIKDLTIDQARNIYLNDFWRALRCDQVPPLIRLMVFDTGVNCGPGFAIKQMQKISGTKVDGVIGSRTVAALNLVQPGSVLNFFFYAREVRYKNHADWNEFGAGWMARLNHVMELSK